MSNIHFIGDLHFGHKNITKFLDEKGRKWRYGETPEDNMKIIAERWNEVVTKRDRVYVLGDCCFTAEGFELLKSIKGSKILVRVNHANFYTTRKWLEVFDEVEGIVRYKNYWLTHAPIHPDELRGKKNIHAHTHHNIIRNADGTPDERYICVSCEIIQHCPISLHQVRGDAFCTTYADMLSNFEFRYSDKLNE